MFFIGQITQDPWWPSSKIYFGAHPVKEPKKTDLLNNKGKSKKDAENKSAKKALRKIKSSV